MPAEIWDDIFARLNHTNRFGEIEYDMAMVIRAMVASKWFLEVFNGMIWKRFCSTFPDFERLKCLYTDRDMTWQEVYKHRISEVIHQEILLVGDQEQPERLHLFQIWGNGRVYISRQVVMGDPFVYDMQPFVLGPDEMITKYGSRYYIMCPIERVMGLGLFIIPDAGSTIKHMQFVSMTTCAPYVVLLTHYGRVFEMALTPSWIEREPYLMPREVSFSEQLGIDEKIIYAKCTLVANYGISNKGRVFAWSTVEDENTGDMQNTPVVLLSLLSGRGVRAIEYVDDEHTNFCVGGGTGSPCSSEKIRVSNEEIYYLIVSG